MIHPEANLFASLRGKMIEPQAARFAGVVRPNYEAFCCDPSSGFRKPEGGLGIDRNRSNGVEAEPFFGEIQDDAPVVRFEIYIG